MDDTQDDFVGEFETKRSSDGYGLVMDKGSAEKQEMAEVFDAPDVGTMMPAENDAGEDAGAQTAMDDAPEAESGPGVDVTPVASATAEATALPAIEGKAVESQQPAKTMSFGEAFKAARAAGEKVFKWNGKSYTTALKSEKPTQRIKPQPKPVEQPVEEAPAEIAKAVFKLESDNGIGPDLTMRPKPDARGIYEGAAIGPNARRDLAAKIDRATSAKVTPMTVTGEDGAQRPARSVAELMNTRKAAQ